LSGDRLQSRTRNYDCPPDCRPHLVRASRSEAPGIRFKSYPTFGRVGFQSWNDCGQPFDINGRGVRQWRTSSRVTLATPSTCFWAPTAAVAQIERAFDASQTTRGHAAESHH